MVGLDSDAALTHATSLGDREGELGIPIEEAKAAMEHQDQGPRTIEQTRSNYLRTARKAKV